MPEIQNHKRFIILYKLGVPIPEELSVIYSSIFEYFDYSNVLKLIDKEGIENTCYIKGDTVLLCVREVILEDMENGVRKYYRDNYLKINSGFFEVQEKFKTNKDIHNIMHTILRYMGINYYKYSFFDSDYIHQHLGYPNLGYYKGIQQKKKKSKK